MADKMDFTETWTAMGTRVMSSGKRGQRWRGPAREYLFEDKASYVIGGSYEVTGSRQVNDETGGDTTWFATCHYLGLDGEAREEAAAWRAAELVAERELSRQARERKDKGAAQRELDRVLRPLEDIAATLTTYQQKDAFAAYVLRRLHSAWK